MGLTLATCIVLSLRYCWGTLLPYDATGSCHRVGVRRNCRWSHGVRYASSMQPVAKRWRQQWPRHHEQAWWRNVIKWRRKKTKKVATKSFSSECTVDWHSGHGCTVAISLHVTHTHTHSLTHIHTYTNTHTHQHTRHKTHAYLPQAYCVNYTSLPILTMPIHNDIVFFYRRGCMIVLQCTRAVRRCMAMCVQ